MGGPVVYVVAVGATAIGSAVLKYYVQTRDDYDQTQGPLEQVSEEVANKLIEDGAPLIETTLEQLGELIGTIGSGVVGGTLAIVRGLAPAVIEGVDAAYDGIRDKLRGKEPDVIAALTIGFGVVFGLVYIYHSFKEANDAFRQGGLQIN